MKTHIIALLLPCLALFAKAEDKAINYRELQRVRVGIDAYVVNDMIQDSTGLFWLCTNTGLYAYDGFTAYPCKFPDDNSRQIQIQCAEISGDHLWLGTDEGVLIYNLKEGKYIDHPITDTPVEFVRSICIVDGKVYAGHTSGILYYDPAENFLGNILITDEKGEKMAVYVIKNIGGIIYFGTFDGLYTIEGSEIRKLNGAQKGVFVSSLCFDESSERIWIGSQNGLWKYSVGDTLLKPVKSGVFQVINDILTDRNSNLVIGSDAGLYVMNGSSISHFEHDSNNSYSLCDNDIESLYLDREGRIWIGTNNGISVANYSQEISFYSISSFTGSSKGMTISSIIPDSDGQGLWCSGSNGIAYLSHEKGSSKLFDIYDEKNPLPHNTVHALFKDSLNGEIWAATDGGVLHYDSKSGNFERVALSIDSYNSQWCHDLALDKDSKLWVGTFSSGIVCGDKVYFESSRKGQVYKLIPDKNGSVWVLYYNLPGLWRIPPGGNEVERFDTPDYFEEQSLPKSMILDEKGRLWIGSERGLLSIDVNSLEMSLISYPDWVTRAGIFSMAVNDRYLWMTTSQGEVLQLNFEESSIATLHIPSNRYTSIAYDSAHDALLLGAVDGFYKITFPLENKDYSHSKVYFMSAEVNGMPYPESSYLGLRFMSRLTLKNDENHVSISFSSMNYTSPLSERYAYLLEPASDKWIALRQGVNNLSLVNLVPGRYRLSVALLDDKGEIVPATIATISMRVKPPFPLSTFAILLYILIISAFTFWAIHYMRVRLKLKSLSFEKELLSKQVEEKIEFMTGISHDLKTPLSLVIGPLTKLLGEEEGNEQVKKQLELAKNNAERLNTLLNRMLDYKVEGADADSLSRSVLDLPELIKHVLERYSLEAQSRGLKIVFNCSATHLYYDCDQHKMESVIDNLISNSFKYTKNGGEIFVSLNVDEEARCLYLSVTDSGIGIPKKDLPYVFQWFYQSSKTRGKFRGTGIGLYLAKKYVEAHGGNICVSSKEDKGTSFIVELPLEKTQVPSEHGFETRSEAGKAYRILIAEDDEALASFLSDLFSSNYEVYTARNGRDAISLFRRIHPDLLVTDMMMPIMDGMELCAKIREDKNSSLVPIIMLTAKATHEMRTESIKAGADALIPKPFDAEQLRLKVASLLEKRSQQKRIFHTQGLSLSIPASEDEKFLAKVGEIIRENLSNPELNVVYLASMVGLSTRQLSRKLQNLTGYSAVDYIKNIRIKRASLLLEQGRFRVAEVMYMVGFTDASYFAKCFQKEFGCTPSRYHK